MPMADNMSRVTATIREGSRRTAQNSQGTLRGENFQLFIPFSISIGATPVNTPPPEQSRRQITHARTAGYADLGQNHNFLPSFLLPFCGTLCAM